MASRALVLDEVSAFAADIRAHQLHDLGARDVVQSGDLDLIAAVDPETPGVCAVAVKRQTEGADDAGSYHRKQRNLQPVGGFLWKRAAADRNAFLPAQECRLFILFEVEEARIKVVFPDPLEPRRQVMLAGATVRETSSKTSARS